MLIKLNLQRFAPQLGNLQINFDSHIKKVVATSSMWTKSYTWTTSGEVIPGDNTMGASYSQIVTFDVTLDDGYVIDNVTLDTSYESKLETKNDKQFTIKCGSDILGGPITITSKKATSQVSIDLTTLSGWGNVADGQHSIQVVAKADGYKDSEKSTAVNFTKAPQVYTDCLTFTGKTSEFTLKATDKKWDGTLEWSTDHNTWTTLTGTEAMQSVNKKLYLRGKGNTKFYNNSYPSGGIQWVLSEKVDCMGNIQTLLDWENPPTIITTNYCYGRMFYNCTNLTSAPKLPATTLASNCYYYMFKGCTNLTTAPELPATTLKKACYQGMFNDCTNLTNAPKLPATTLAYECYNNMFYNCTNLTSAPKLPATTLADRCYMSMFSSCTNLTTAPELPATTLESSCYENMFYNCTNLTRTPELLATTLESACYAQMFYNCTNLTNAPKLPATTLASNCYYNMFKGCSKLKVNITSGTKIFTCPSTIPSYAVNNMFSGTGGTFTGTPTAGNTYYWTA